MAIDVTHKIWLDDRPPPPGPPIPPGVGIPETTGWWGLGKKPPDPDPDPRPLPLPRRVQRPSEAGVEVKVTGDDAARLERAAAARGQTLVDIVTELLSGGEGAGAEAGDRAAPLPRQRRARPWWRGGLPWRNRQDSGRVAH